MPYEILEPAAGRYEILPPETSTMDKVKQQAGNVLAGAVRGAGSIGGTIVDAVRSQLAQPTLDAVPAAMRPEVTGGLAQAPRGDQLRSQMDAGLQSMGAQPDALAFKGGKIGAEILGTMGVGGALAKPIQALAASRYGAGIEPLLEGAARGLQTGGFRVGELAGTGAGAATRIGTGALAGGASAGLVNPQDAGMGAAIGGGLPGAAQLAGKAGGAIRNALTPEVAPEVRALAQRAQELGINIPADRLTNSRPLNAAAASLNYVPFSGRAATEEAMGSQLNKALSRTFGQDSSNVTMALRKAETTLGGQFDNVLKNNVVNVDQTFMQELAESANRASRELGSDGAGIIGKQVEDIVAKAGTGQIDGQAAYNIKKTLDRIGQRNTPEAFYANDLKKSLMGALNRSLGPEQAAAFAQTRQQYGAMLDLQRIAKNGAEGEISVARLANMRNIHNPQMQELADIAAQFVKPREGIHGGAQRVFGAGGLLGAGAIAGGPVGAGLAAAGGMAGGRAMNGLLNSQAAKNFVLGGPRLLAEPEALGLLTQGAYRSLPLIPAQ